MQTPVLAAPVVDEGAVTFFLPDEDRALAEVKLVQEIARPRMGPDFTFDDEAARWELSFELPDADRMEYKFHLVHKDGSSETIPDPANPLVAAGPFGDKSVVEFPGYEPPAWVSADGAEGGSIIDTSIKSRALRTSLRAILWTSAGHDFDAPLPLLVAHDGLEYAEYSDLLRLLNIRTLGGELPPMRAALIAPVDRNHTYSASAVYARTLSYELLPALDQMAPTPHGRRMRVGMGASLGALAMLHDHRTSPATFGSLFLQSGSYFRQRYDKQESSFPRFGRISRFMGRVLTARDWPHPIPVTMTCGTVEENLANNRATAASLHRQGYDVRFHANRDGHNWIGWRDAFDPHLIELLARVWA